MPSFFLFIPNKVKFTFFIYNNGYEPETRF